MTALKNKNQFENCPSPESLLAQISGDVRKYAKPSYNPAASARAWLRLPFQLYLRKDGRWLLLNRHRKPLGMPGRGHVDYESLAPAVLASTIPYSHVTLIASPGSVCSLFDDRTRPWARSSESSKRYLRLLDVLFARGIDA